MSGETQRIFSPWRIGPSHKLEDYAGFCVQHPTIGGLLVAKGLFNYNGLSYKCITSNTKPASLPSVTPSRPSPPHCCPLLLVARRTQRCSGHRHCLCPHNLDNETQQVTCEIRQTWESVFDPSSHRRILLRREIAGQCLIIFFGSISALTESRVETKAAEI